MSIIIEKSTTRLPNNVYGSKWVVITWDSQLQKKSRQRFLQVCTFEEERHCCAVENRLSLHRLYFYIYINLSSDLKFKEEDKSQIWTKCWFISNLSEFELKMQVSVKKIFSQFLHSDCVGHYILDCTICYD